MLTRIVKLEFQPDKVEKFLDFFDAIKDTLRQQDGCKEIRLMRDLNQTNIIFSYSVWEEGLYLEQYLKSDFFRDLWVKIKPSFSDRPMAWSVGVLEK